MEVRLGNATGVGREVIQKESNWRHIHEIVVFKPDLVDARMRNIVLPAEVIRNRLIPELKMEHFRQAIKDLMSGAMMETNMAMLDSQLKPPVCGH